MSFIREWDAQNPQDTRKKNNFADDIRNTRVDIGERYVDVGCYGVRSPATPVVPSSSGVVSLVEGNFGTQDELIFYNDTPVAHTLLALGVPLFFDSSRDLIFGYDTAGDSYYSKRIEVTIEDGNTTGTVAHGITGDIVTNDKVYGITCSLSSPGHTTFYSYSDNSASRAHKKCEVSNANVLVVRGGSSGSYTYYVDIIYKD